MASQRNARLSFKDGVRLIDKFGCGQSFYLRGKKRVKTIIGSLISIACCIAVAFYVYSKIVILATHQNPAIIYNKVLSQKHEVIDTWGHNLTYIVRVKVNNTLLKPSQFSKYLVIQLSKQMINLKAVNGKNAVERVYYNMTTTPCSLHSKYSFFKKIVEGNPQSLGMLNKYSVCFERNESLIKDGNEVNITSVGGGLQNLPIQILNMVVAHCVTLPTAACAGFSPFDKVELTVEYPQLKYQMSDKLNPLSYSLGSMRPITLVSQFTQQFTQYLNMVQVYDKGGMISSDQLIDKQPLLDRIDQLTYKLPGVYAVINLRNDRTSIKITRIYYALINAAVDFGGVLEAAAIIALLVNYFNSQISYKKQIRALNSTIPHTETISSSKIQISLEISEKVRSSIAFERIIKPALVKPYQGVIISLLNKVEPLQAKLESSYLSHSSTKLYRVAPQQTLTGKSFISPAVLRKKIKSMQELIKPTAFKIELIN